MNSDKKLQENVASIIESLIKWLANKHDKFNDEKNGVNTKQNQQKIEYRDKVPFPIEIGDIVKFEVGQISKKL